MSNAKPTTIRGHITNATGAMLGTVASIANTADRSVSMLDAFIVKAKAQQTISHAVEMDTYEVNAILEAAAEQQRIEEAILREMHADPVRKAHFDRIHARIAEAVAKATAAAA